VSVVRIREVSVECRVIVDTLDISYDDLKM